MSIAVPASFRGRFAFSTPLFVGSVVCLCLAEAFAIRGLWFRAHAASRPIHGFDLPILMWTPAVGAFILLQSIRRIMRKGLVSPPLAAGLSTGVALVLLIAYLLMTRLAQIAFR